MQAETRRWRGNAGRAPGARPLAPAGKGREAWELSSRAETPRRQPGSRRQAAGLVYGGEGRNIGARSETHPLTSVHPPPGGDRPPASRQAPRRPTTQSSRSPEFPPRSLTQLLRLQPERSAHGEQQRQDTRPTGPGPHGPAGLQTRRVGLPARPYNAAARLGQPPPRPGAARRGHPAQIPLRRPRPPEGVSSPPRPAPPRPLRGDLQHLRSPKGWGGAQIPHPTPAPPAGIHTKMKENQKFTWRAGSPEPGGSETPPLRHFVSSTLELVGQRLCQALLGR